MSDLLEGIQRNIRERLDKLRPLVGEYEQLHRAMSAHEGLPAGQQPARAKPRAASFPGPQARPRRHQPGTSAGGCARASGWAASQLAEASGVQRTVVYGVLRRLIDEGTIDKQEHPETGTRYAVVSANHPTSLPRTPIQPMATAQAALPRESDAAG